MRVFLEALRKADVPSPAVDEAPHASFEELWGDCGREKKKHRVQESSLVRHMGVEDDVTDFVEFGCGVAALSAHVAALKPAKARRFHLLDRQSFRSNVRRDKEVRKLGYKGEKERKDVLEF